MLQNHNQGLYFWRRRRARRGHEFSFWLTSSEQQCESQPLIFVIWRWLKVGRSVHEAKTWETADCWCKPGLELDRTLWTRPEVQFQEKAGSTEGFLRSWIWIRGSRRTWLSVLGFWALWQFWEEALQSLDLIVRLVQTRLTGHDVMRVQGRNQVQQTGAGSGPDQRSCGDLEAVAVVISWGAAATDWWTVSKVNSNTQTEILY